MAIRLPDFQTIGINNVYPGNIQPTYSGADPEAAAQATLGQGLQKLGEGFSTAAGAAASQVGREKHVSNQLEGALAQATLFERLADDKQQLQHITDPEEVNQLYARQRQHLDDVAASLTDPTYRTLWRAKHLDDAVKVELSARERQQGIFQDRLLAGSQAQLEGLIRRAQQSADPAAHQEADKGIGDIITSLRDAGVISDTKAGEIARRAHEDIVTGTTHYLLGTERPAEAQDYLSRNKNALDPAKFDPLMRQARGQADHKIANEYGDAVSAGRRVGPAEQGAVSPGQVASAAARNGIDPAMLNAFAGIESSHGANAGSSEKRYAGIFQLGAEERVKAGGSAASIGSLDDQVEQGAKFIAGLGPQTENLLGRKPANWEVYMMHQQGPAGFPALAANRDKRAIDVVPEAHITGNVPRDLRQQSRDWTAGQFLDFWKERYNREEAKFRGIKADPLEIQAGQGQPPAAPTGQPRMPSLEEQVQQIESSSLTPDQQEIAKARVLRNDSVRQRGMRTEIVRTKQLMADDLASIAASGKIVPEITRDRVAAAQGEEAADKFEDDRDTALKFYEQTSDFDHLPSTELHRRLNMMATEGEGQPGYEKRQKLFRMAERKADELEKSRLADPAAAVSRFPEVVAASQGANLNQPETYRPLVKARIQAMGEIDTPFDAMVPISREEAATLYRPVGVAASTGDARALKAALSRVVQTVQTGWGGYSDVALAAVLQAGHADLQTREAAMAAVKKLSQSQTPTPGEAKAVDEAARSGAITGAVTGLAEPTTQPRAAYPVPDPEAITMLRTNPQTRDAFDQTYGPGAADKIFAIAPPREPGQRPPGDRGRR